MYRSLINIFTLLRLDLKLEYMKLFFIHMESVIGYMI